MKRNQKSRSNCIKRILAVLFAISLAVDPALSLVTLASPDGAGAQTITVEAENCVSTLPSG